MKPPRAVLALDLGMTKAHPTGWATSSRTGVVRSGELVLEGRARKDRGARWEFFRDWLERQFRDVGPDLVAYEMPPLAKGGLTGRLSLLGLVVVTEELAWRWGIPVRSIAPATLKKETTGSGRASKDDVAAAVCRRYPDQALVGPDQADALAVLHWALTTVLGVDPRGERTGERC